MHVVKTSLRRGNGEFSLGLGLLAVDAISFDAERTGE